MSYTRRVIARWRRCAALFLILSGNHLILVASDRRSELQPEQRLPVSPKVFLPRPGLAAVADRPNLASGAITGAPGPKKQTVDLSDWSVKETIY